MTKAPLKLVNLFALMIVVASCQSGRPSLSDVPPPPSSTLREELIKSLQEEE